MSDIEIINGILNVIKDNVSLYKESATELQIRCPYCGDSKSNKRKCSMNISKYPIEKYGNLNVFHCFRAGCGAAGTLYSLINDLGFIDLLSDEQRKFLLSKRKKKFGNIRNNSIKFSRRIFELNKDDKKIEYVKSRLGVDEIPEFILSKLVTHVNYNESFNVRRELVDYLNSKFVGFKTYDESKIIFRNIENGNDFRYYTFRLSQSIDYFIASPLYYNINLLKPGLIVMAEGIFSVLRGYLYILNSGIVNTKNIILGATLGGVTMSYMNLYNFIVHTFGIPDWRVYILSDSEIPLDRYRVFSKNIFGGVKILYNDGKLDFGEDRGNISIFNLTGGGI